MVTRVEGAELARQISLAAARAGVIPIAGALHTLYSYLGTTERRLATIERRDTGVFAERKIARAGKRARSEARALFDPYRPATKVSTHPFAPAAGLALGALALAATVALTGTYRVPDNGAVLLDPISGRATKALAALGLPLGDVPPQTQTVRQPGFHWTLPYPLTDRHTVTLELQQLLLRARFRQTGPNSFDVVEAQIQFRITDLDKWAALDGDGTGTSQLQTQLSRVLETFVQRSRQEARDTLTQQNPALASDPAQLMARADQMAEGQLEAVVRSFVAAVGNSPAARDAGIQISSEHRSRIARGVSGDQAVALVGEE
jgi:hypothetical protein